MAEFYIENGTVFMPTTVTIPTPDPGGNFLFVKNRAGRLMFGQMGQSGVDYTFQPGLYANKIGYWNPPGNVTTAPGLFGMGLFTATGTATARAVATTNLFTRTRRVATVSAGTAGSLTGYRGATLQYTMGSGTILGGGGFYYVIRFGISDVAAVAGARMFVGLRNTAGAPTNVEPSTLTQCIGVGHGAANNNLFIYYGGSAAQAPIDLTSTFPTNTRSVDLYELTLFCSPTSNNSVTYRVERLNTGDVTSGVLTTVTAGVGLPLNTALLINNDYRTNNATASAVGIDYVSVYYETDY
jgi:hypothetical protein